MCALLNRIGWHRQNTFRGSSGVDKMNSHGVPWEIALNLAFSIVSLLFFYFCFPIFNFVTVACQANPCMSPTILILYLTDCASPSSSSASLSKVSSSWGTNSTSSSSSRSTLGSSGPCCYSFSAVFFTAGISCSWSPAASGFSSLSNTFYGKISNGCMGLGSKAFMQLMMTSIVCIFCHRSMYTSFVPKFRNIHEPVIFLLGNSALVHYNYKPYFPHHCILLHKPQMQGLALSWDSHINQWTVPWDIRSHGGSCSMVNNTNNNNIIILIQNVQCYWGFLWDIHWWICTFQNILVWLSSKFLGFWQSVPIL